jgi:hypothetical protein
MYSLGNTDDSITVGDMILAYSDMYKSTIFGLCLNVKHISGERYYKIEWLFDENYKDIEELESGWFSEKKIKLYKKALEE